MVMLVLIFHSLLATRLMKLSNGNLLLLSLPPSFHLSFFQTCFSLLPLLLSLLSLSSSFSVLHLIDSLFWRAAMFFSSSFSPLRRITQKTGCSVSRATNKTPVPGQKKIFGNKTKKKKQTKKKYAKSIVTCSFCNDATITFGTRVHLPKNSLFSHTKATMSFLNSLAAVSTIPPLSLLVICIANHLSILCR